MAVWLAGCELVPLPLRIEASPEDGCADADGDGHADARCGGDDCRDDAAAIFPGAAEQHCNGVDDDCDPGSYDNPDADGDGVAACDGDCDDADGGRAPGNLELSCNGIDDDCDARTPDDDGSDFDGDGASACLDCHDGNATVYPGAPEICGDAVDQDCDGSAPGCALCGNGVVEDGEACDDGNQLGGDGCRADCRGLEVCGDGLFDPQSEQCDPPQDGGCIGLCAGCACPGGPWRFEDATAEAGLVAVHAYDPSLLDPFALQSVSVSGGLAAGDIDDDGDVDFYSVGGALGQSALWLNQGDGSFADATSLAGIVPAGPFEAGPLIADVDGDGDDDLLIGGVAGTPLRLYRNQLDGTFADDTAARGLSAVSGNVVSAAMGDSDGDGDLDLALGCWGTPAAEAEHLWRNDAGLFTPAGDAAGLGGLGVVLTRVYSFTPTFDHLNADGWLDVVFASDFGTSRAYLSDGGGGYVDVTSAAISDENGMGSATGDVDGDGDVDWFVSSVWDPNGVAESNWGVSGNRLYLNDGSGVLSDGTSAAGVRRGYWGWASCLADFDNDGHLDIFHVNGFTQPRAAEFFGDPAVLFLSGGDGTFSERAAELGLWETDQGRGVSCSDVDGDGAIDILIHNNLGPLRLWRNNATRVGHHLVVRLSAPPPNARGIGARIALTAGGRTQWRTIRAGSNYASQDPALAHFGLGAATSVDSLVIHWPDGSQSSLEGLAADQGLTVVKP